MIGGGRVDEGRNAHRLAGCGKVFAVEEGAGPILDGVVVWDFGLPVSLAAVKSNAAVDGHGAAGCGLAAAEETMFEVVYGGRYA